MLLRHIAWIFGIALVSIGLLGFVPGITTSSGLLLGIFQVDTVHNFIHLMSGIAAIVVALMSENAARRYFQVFGVVYALVAIMGLVNGSGSLWGLMSINGADNVLHLLIAAVSLYVGFAMRTRELALPEHSSSLSRERYHAT